MTKRLNITFRSSRLERRVRDIAKDKGLSLNQLINTAVEEYVNRVDLTHSAPDYVLDRMNQVMNSQLKMMQNVSDIKDLIEGWLEENVDR